MTSMNNNVSVAFIDTLIEENYERYIFTLLQMSSLAFLFYAALSNLAEEAEYIWLKPFSLPTLLYIFARYAALIGEGLSFTANKLVPLGRSCNMIANAANSMTVLSYIGIQGLVFARVYSLCCLYEGTRMLPVALALCFIVHLIVPFYGMIAFPGCLTSLSAESNLILLTENILTIIADTFFHSIFVWKLWETWKLNREAGIQNRRSLTSAVLKQCLGFIAISSISHVIRLIIGGTFSDTHMLRSASRTPFMAVNSNLAGVLVANFTLDLRRHNSAKASNITLPTLQSSNVFQRAYQSLLVEMAIPEGNAEDCDHDKIPESVNDIGHVKNITFRFPGNASEHSTIQRTEFRYI